MLFIETCSLQNAAPSPIAMSHIVYFHSDCLGWREIFQAWTERLLLKVCAITNMPALPNLTDSPLMLNCCTCFSRATRIRIMHIMSQLGERTLSVIKELVDEHVPEIINFIATQCQTVQPVSTICMIRSFCELMHYHFFLGQEVSRLHVYTFVDEYRMLTLLYIC